MWDQYRSFFLLAAAQRKYTTRATVSSYRRNMQMGAKGRGASKTTPVIMSRLVEVTTGVIETEDRAYPESLQPLTVVRAMRGAATERLLGFPGLSCPGWIPERKFV